MNYEGGPASRAFGLEQGEGNARWGGLATIKAAGNETGNLYSIVEVLEPQGAQAPFHLHRKVDEGFWILEAEMTFHIGEETIKARPGSFVFGPKDVPHRYTVDSGPARLLFILSPSGFEDFIYATSEPAKQLTLPPPLEGPPDEAEMEQLGAIARQYGAELFVQRAWAGGGRPRPPPCLSSPKLVRSRPKSDAICAHQEL